MLKTYELPPAEPATDRGIGTDLDASERLAEYSKDRLRYVPGIGWHVWDGRRWAEDNMGEALEISKGCAKAWTMRWAASNEPNRDAKLKQAMVLESSGHIVAALKLAETDPRLVLSHTDLDADPWKLTVRNGTLDLRSGKLLPHDRADMISKLAPVTYDPNATHPVVDRVMGTIDRASPGMSEFLARCFGVALTGDASTESLFLLQGDGASGKTTIAEGIANSLGDYSVKLPFAAFCLSKFGTTQGPTPEFARLRGSRFAFASEGDVSARLDAGSIKMLTGGEAVTARKLFENPITFGQTWKLWLVTNFDPKADSDDSGLWRRILKIHFEAVPVQDRDPTVKEALASNPEAQSALLAWAVRGCLDWQARERGRKGLAPPSFVLNETEEYRKKLDALGQWLEDALAEGGVRSPNVSTLRSTLRRHYEEWCDDNGSHACSTPRFASFLEREGFESVRGSGGVRRWKGILLAGE